MATKVKTRGETRARRRSALVGRIGGLAAEVAAEELAALNDDAVRGALLAIAQRARDGKLITEWEQAGREWCEKRALSQTKIMGLFESPVPPAAAKLLRRAGLSQDRELRKVWRGRANPDIAVPLIEGAGGQATIL